MKKAFLFLAAVSLAFVGCKDNIDNDLSLDPADINGQMSVNVELSGTYSQTGSTVALPNTILTVLDMTKDEFISGLGSTVKIGYTTETPVAVSYAYSTSNVKWETVEWFNQNGEKAGSNDQAVNVVLNKDYTATVNLAEELCGKGNTYYATLVFQRTVEDGGLHTAFVKYAVKSVMLYDLVNATTSFSMNTGIVAAVKMAVKQNGREYRAVSIELPASVYATLKAIQGSYDNLAYFISSGQIKSYAFPKCAGLGSQTTDTWFDNTGAEATSETGALHASLYLEPGNPIQGGGRDVNIVLDQKIGSLKAGDKFNCGFIFVYGTIQIPLIIMMEVVSEL